MIFTSSEVSPMTTEAAAMSGDLVQGLSSWERILVTREWRYREVGTRLPGCTETLTTPAGTLSLSCDYSAMAMKVQFLYIDPGRGRANV